MANIKEAFQYAAQNPNSDFAKNLEQLAASGSLDQEAKKYGIDTSVFKPKPTAIQEIGKSLDKRATDLATAIKQTGEGMSQAQNIGTVGKTIGRGLLRSGGAIAGATLDTLGTAASSVAKGVDTALGNIPSSAIKAGGEAFLATETGKNALAKLQEGTAAYEIYKQQNPEGAKDLESAIDIANVIPAVKGTMSLAKGAVKLTETAAKKATKEAVKVGNIVKEGVSPTPTPTKALGEVSVAKKTEQLPTFEKALSAVDTTKVKTFDDLNRVFNDAVPALAKQVDNELLKDTNTYQISDLLVPQKTKADKEIKTDYITRAIDGLKDLYTKLGDDVAKADIEDFQNKALTQGLTRKEVNDLARQYNTEYGSKAFTATGDIKQGFSAELYESTRKGLKDIARAGLGGTEAQKLDDLLSSVYEAQKLTKKNADAVNALKQRIEEKGWVGTGIRKIFEASDLITGGAVRALRDTVLARGNAQKLQNILELENKLQKNLEVLRKVNNASSQTEAENVIKNAIKTKVK